MFREMKPKKAKYGFHHDMGYDPEFNPAAFIETVMAGIQPNARKGESTWWKEVSNGMGKLYVTVYFDDEVLYQKFKAANDAGVQQPKLVLALPDYEKQRIEIASDEMIDGERVVCIAIKGNRPAPKFKFSVGTRLRHRNGITASVVMNRFQDIDSPDILYYVLDTQDEPAFAPRVEEFFTKVDDE